MNINDCSITITTSNAIFTTSGISFDNATQQRWDAERAFSNSGYIWVQRGYFQGQEIRNIWVNEATRQTAQITITCGNVTYPS